MRHVYKYRDYILAITLQAILLLMYIVTEGPFASCVVVHYRCIHVLWSIIGVFMCCGPL